MDLEQFENLDPARKINELNEMLKGNSKPTTSMDEFLKGFKK